MTPNSPSSHGSAESKHRSVQETEQFKKEENKHDEGKMFIGGLNWETSDENLKSYFSQFGEVTDCVVMRDPNSSRSRGFGFVTFTDPSNVDKVLNKDHQLDGKVIDPKRAIPRDEQEKTEKIFVGGIAPEVTEEEFKQYFLQFGNIVDATLMVDRDSGRPRGFGFITFDSSDPVEKAMARRDLEIQNKAIEVKLAMPKHKTQRFGHFGASYGPSSSPGGPPPPGSGPMSVIASPGNGAVNNGRYGSSYPMGGGKDGGGGGYSNMGGYNGGSYSGYGGYGGYSNYTNPYPGNYHHYNAMPQTYYSSRYGGYNNNYGGGGYGGSGSRGGGGSYGQWYGRDGGAPGSGMNGGPASNSRLGGGGGYRHSPVREEYNGRDHHYHYHHHHHPGNPPHPPPPPPMYGGRGGNATRGAPLRSYSSSLNTGSTGAIYASHSVRGQHDYHPYPR